MIVAGVYKVERVLKQGVHAMTAFAMHTQYQMPVVLELVWPLHIDSATIAMFLDEARRASAMRSPHVARALDAGALEDGGFYLAAERFDGETLASILAQRGPFTANTAAHYIQRVAEALVEAHARGLVHRHLDLGCVLATNTHGMKLTGLASLGSLIDTPYAVDPRNNIYALGAMLLELLGNKSYAPPGLILVAQRCMDPEPARRYQRAQDIALALAPFTATNVLREGPRFTPANLVAIED